MTDILSVTLHFQPKTHKVKQGMWVASANPYECMFTSFGEYLHHHKHRPNYEVFGGHNFLFPDLARSRSPAAQVTGWLKDILDDKSATANGVRPGVANHLAKFMPADFIACITGHEMRWGSALYDYLDVDLAILGVGARVLAGWKPPEWGRLGEGPRHASLEPITMSGVDMSILNAMINEMFHLHQQSPPQMQSAEWEPDDRFNAAEKAALLDKRAVLRPVVEAAFASLIMHFEDRVETGEMRSVSTRLLELARRNCPASGDALELLKRWSGAVKAKFMLDNHHLLDPKTSPPEQVASSSSSLPSLSMYTWNHAYTILIHVLVHRSTLISSSDCLRVSNNTTRRSIVFKSRFRR